MAVDPEVQKLARHLSECSARDYDDVLQDLLALIDAYRVPEPDTPEWQSLLRRNLRRFLAAHFIEKGRPTYVAAMNDLDNGVPYVVIIGAIEATRQTPPVRYSVAKANLAKVTYMQLQAMEQKGLL